jgi:hypothetical protein
MKKENSLKVNIDYYMGQEMPDVMKKRFKELQEQIDNLKTFDSNSYVDNLERHFENMQDEIQVNFILNQALNKIRKKEDRINMFNKTLSNFRIQNQTVRNELSNSLKIKDSKCVFALGPMMS